MINSIIEAISIALKNEFTEKEYEFRSEEIKQGLKEPCFFISCLNPTNEVFLGKRYFRQNDFVIQYFPETDRIQRECNDVAERLNNCLEYITVHGEDKPVRGTEMKHQVVDGVLHYFVNYDLFVSKTPDDLVYMETLIIDTDAKEGE